MRILAAGDSIVAAREGDTGLDEGFPVLMGLHPTMCQGVSGSIASQWAEDYNGRLTRAINTPAETVIISLLAREAFAAMSDHHITSDEISVGLLDFRRVVKKLLRPLTIVILYADPFFGDKIETRIAVPILNACITEACVGLPVVRVDMGEWLTRKDYNGIDIHPIRDGHEVIACKMKALVSEYSK